MNQLNIIYYAATDSTINIKVMNSRQVESRNLTFMNNS